MSGGWHRSPRYSHAAAPRQPAFCNPIYRAMRPALLDRLFAPVTVLPGIGPQLAQADRARRRPAGASICCGTCRPASSTAAPRRRSASSTRATGRTRSSRCKARVERHEPGFGRRPSRVVCSDGTGTLVLVYFNVKGDQLQRLLPVGAERVVSGKVEYLRRHAADRASRPRRAAPTRRDADPAAIEPVYPLTAGLSSRVLCARPSPRRWSAPRSCRNGSIRRCASGAHWPGWREALAAAHAPQSAADLDPRNPGARAARL